MLKLKLFVCFFRIIMDALVDEYTPLWKDITRIVVPVEPVVCAFLFWQDMFVSHTQVDSKSVVKLEKSSDDFQEVFDLLGNE